jgi:hypothetical protein
MDRIVKDVTPKLNKQAKVLRVAAYGRVSSGKDAMLHSLAAQVSYYSQYIQSHHGWALFAVIYLTAAVKRLNCIIG